MQFRNPKSKMRSGASASGVIRNQNDWKQAVDETRLLTSYAYHLLRELHGLEPVRYLGPKFPHILDDLFLSEV